MGWRNHAFDAGVLTQQRSRTTAHDGSEKAAANAKGQQAQAVVPTRDSEQRERPEDRQYDKRNQHPLNEDPDVPAQPRR